jgi:hypothetical protein
VCELQLCEAVQAGQQCQPMWLSHLPLYLQVAAVCSCNLSLSYQWLRLLLHLSTVLVMCLR